jgi:hypothetical protein
MVEESSLLKEEKKVKESLKKFALESKYAKTSE